jgi:predicted ABC-class ATPase
MAIEQPEDKIITFEQYYDVMLAHIIRTKLEDNGVPCFIADDNIISANPLYKRGRRHQTKNI